MKIYDVEVNINGKMILGVEAESREDAKRKADELLSKTTIKQALEEHRKTLRSYTKFVNEKSLER